MTRMLPRVAGRVTRHPHVNHWGSPMFRLIQLHPGDWTATAYVHGDGYTNESGAWAAYAPVSDYFFGVGRLDAAGAVTEISIDPACPARTGESNRCLAPVTHAVRAAVYLRRCADCASAGTLVTLDELALEIGAEIRTAQLSGEQEHRLRTGPASALSRRIRLNLARCVIDPAWRRSVCVDLDSEPDAVDGLVEAVRRLSDRQVLDLYPDLRALAEGLPTRVCRNLRGGLYDRLSPAGVAAARLGLAPRPGQPG